jgi:WD40 repeat protein
VDEGRPRVLWQADVAERGGVYNGVLSPDGKTLAMGTDGGVTLLDVATKQVRRRLPTPLDGVALKTAFSPDGRYLAADATSDDWRGFAFVVVWDVAQEKRIRLIKLEVRDIDALAFHPDNRMLAVAAGSVELFDLGDPPARRGTLDELSENTLRHGIGWTEPIASHFVGSGFYESLRFSANGRALKVICFGGDVVRLSPRSGRVLSRSRPPDGQEVWATAVSDQGLAAAAVKDSNSIVLWDVPRWAGA